MSLMMPSYMISFDMGGKLFIETRKESQRKTEQKKINKINKSQHFVHQMNPVTDVQSFVAHAVWASQSER